jgi:glycosyltransferase involved in cell wall biosynthesis
VDCIISIIVPIYNVEEYIHKCINSIIAQTFRKFELILIDDGSKDNSGKICDEYALRDSRIRVIHKKNGGVSSARNAGLDIAQGEYIGFIDPDDWVEEDMYEVLYQSLLENDCDISICGVKSFSINDGVKSMCNIPNKFICDGLEAMQFILKGGSCIAVWNRLYRRKIFLNLRLLEGKIHEDVFILSHIFQKNFKVVFVPDEKYHYLIRNNGIMGEVFKKPSIDMVDSYKYLLDSIKENSLEILQDEIWHCVWFPWALAQKIYERGIVYDNYGYLENVKLFIREYLNEILKSRYITNQKKIRMLAFVILGIRSYYIYYIFIKIKNKTLLTLGIQPQ